MSAKHIIYAQSLYELVELKKRVDPFELLNTSEGIYNSIKAIGVNETTIYFKKNGQDIYQKGQEISIEMRAIAAFIIRLKYRWNDDNMGRIEEHYGLPTMIEGILNTKLLKKQKNYLSLPCISIREVIEDYLN